MIIMFTGHRNSKREARLDLIGLGNLLRKFITEDKYITFIAGGCPGFDTMAMDVLRDLEVPETQCGLYLPANSPVVDAHDPHGTRAAEMVYERIKQRVHVITQDSFAARCMMRNQAMVDVADICITNLTETSGGTFRTVEMAKRKDIQIYYVKGDKYESVNAR